MIATFQGIVTDDPTNLGLERTEERKVDISGDLVNDVPLAVDRGI